MFCVMSSMQPDELPVNNDAFFAEVEQMLAQGHSVTLRGRGGSMYPFIADGRDSVVLSRAAGLQVGDIVLARVPGKGYVLHRIYRLQGDRLTLMGDGNLQATEQCRKADVRGRVTEILRGGRRVECGSRAERFRAACWRKLLPVRRYLLRVCRLCQTLKERNRELCRH